MKCPVCGYDLPNDSKFCSYCGSSLGRGNAEPASNHAQMPVSKPYEEAPSKQTAYAQTSVPPQPHKIAKKAQADKCLRMVRTLTPFFVLPIIALIVCINEKDFYSPTEVYYIVSIVLCIIAACLLIMNFAFPNAANISTTISAFITLGAIVPLCLKPLEDTHDAPVVACFLIAAIICLVVLAILQVYCAVDLHIKKYHKSATYKMRSVQKLEKLNTLRAGGIITAEEYAYLRGHLFEKMS